MPAQVRPTNHFDPWAAPHAAQTHHTEQAPQAGALAQSALQALLHGQQAPAAQLAKKALGAAAIKLLYDAAEMIAEASGLGSLHTGEGAAAPASPAPAAVGAAHAPAEVKSEPAVGGAAVSALLKAADGGKAPAQENTGPVQQAAAPVAAVAAQLADTPPAAEQVAPKEQSAGLLAQVATAAVKDTGAAAANAGLQPAAQQPVAAPPTAEQAVPAPTHAPEAVPGAGVDTGAIPSSVQAPGSTPAAEPAKAADWHGVLTGGGVLKSGDSGAAVQSLQSQLRTAGFPVPLTGTYDAATLEAVKKFQETYHIQTTGMIGAQTSNGLEEVVAWRGVQSGKHILNPGDSGPAVLMLQRELLRAGKPIKLTGIYDKQTRAQVNEVQSGHGWTPDGQVGPLTVGAIREEGAEPDAQGGADPGHHMPKSGDGRAVYQHNQARVANMDVKLDGEQKGEMKAFIANWDKNHARYEKIAAKAGIPAEVIASLHWRESSGNFNTYLHQGDPLGKPAVHEPNDIPVFYKWEDAAVHALHSQRAAQDLFNVTQHTTDKAALASYAEYYNGLGYHYKDKPSPYVFSGTDQYTKGKYTRDRYYDPNVKDQQLGVMSMYQALKQHEQEQGQGQPAPDGQTQAPKPKGEVALTDAPRPWLEELEKEKPKNPNKPAPGSENTTPPDGSMPGTEVNHKPGESESGTGNDWGSVAKGKATLRHGTEGASVTQMQQLLTQAGYGVARTGVFGDTTQQTLERFQSTHNLPVTGELDATTAKALEAAVKAKSADSKVQEDPNGERHAPKSEEDKFEYYKLAITAQGGKFDERPGQRNIMGVRGWQQGGPVPNTKDRYNDTLVVMWVDEKGQKHVHEYKSTTDPGAYAKYYNPAGDANLMDGQYNYQLGSHKGHTALNQGEAVRVWRDANKDGIRQKGEYSEAGWFGINIHAGGTSESVSNYSAGCQVIQGGWDGAAWKDFIKQMQADPDHKYKYTLIDSSKMPKI